MREKLAQENHMGCLPNSLFVLPETPQVKGIHTFIRDRETDRDEFVFYSKRLMRLLMEYSLSLLPFNVRPFKSRSSLEETSLPLR